VVGHDEHFSCVVELQPPDQVCRGRAGLVVVGAQLRDRQVVVADAAFGKLVARRLRREVEPVLPRQPVTHPEPDVPAVACVLAAGIS
jgi:hypothetical protein